MLLTEKVKIQIVKFFSNIFSLDLGNNNNYDTAFNQMNSDLNDFLQDYNGDN